MRKITFSWIMSLCLISVSTALLAEEVEKPETNIDESEKKQPDSENKASDKKEAKKKDGKKKEEKKGEEKKEAEKKDEPPKKGNFALPGYQQPGSLVAFGDNILDKKQSVLALQPDLFVGDSRHLSDVLPSFLYGFTDRFSGYLVTPYAPSYQIGPVHSHGWEDFIYQLEYAYYVRENKRYSDQATVVVNMSAPTGSVIKNPLTGAGAITTFAGLTFIRLTQDYLGFTSQGVLYPTSHEGTQLGWDYFYQFGVGKNFAYKTDKWIFAGILELDGEYSDHNKIQGVIDPNSGGNVIYLTPSLWYSRERLILQFGVGFPVVQHLFGDQINFDCFYVANISWTFGKFT